MNGFGYSSNGINGPYGTAMTMDGAIVADFITAGILSANLIKAGTMNLSRLYGSDLVLGGNGNGRGRIIIKDENAVDKIVADNLGISLLNGSRLIGGNGVLSNFQFQDNNFLGYTWALEQYHKCRLMLDVNIPDNFVVTSAKIVLEHRPIYWNYTEGSSIKNVWGYSRNIKLYKLTTLDSIITATAFRWRIG